MCDNYAGTLEQESPAPLPDPQILADRERALRHWEEHHYNSRSLKENMQLLRQHYSMAKQLGDKVAPPDALSLRLKHLA